MEERQDVVYIANCYYCLGKKVDPKKRKRKCPECNGSGKRATCATCGHDIPCPGTDDDMFDQGYCLTRYEKK